VYFTDCHFRGMAILVKTLVPFDFGLRDPGVEFLTPEVDAPSRLLVASLTGDRRKETARKPR
jgi:hypothetical protein